MSPQATVSDLKITVGDLFILYKFAVCNLIISPRRAAGSSLDVASMTGIA